MNLQAIRMLNSWPLCIAPVHSSVGEGARLLRRKPIDWRKKCHRAEESTEERAAQGASIKFVQL